jgi:citrate synthase
VYAARWKPSFVARYAPDLSGRYEWDGETLDVCTVQDGVLGEGRMAAYLHSQDGGFSAIATGRWSVAQGGYAGVMIHSNDTTHSGPLLLYGHRDGSVRVRSGAFYYSAETLRDMAPSFPRMVPVFRGYTAAACDLLPPRPRLAQMSAPDLSGNYLSNYNESIAVCTRGGSLVAAFSGVGYQQGFAMGRWVDAAGRWEGTVAEIGRDSHPFTWRLAGDVLSGDWSVYNRTNPWADNSTSATAGEARRDPSGAARRWLALKGGVPGFEETAAFGRVDPRTRPLLEATGLPADLQALLAEGEAAAGRPAGFHLALALIARRLDLGPTGAGDLLLLGRLVGLLAHAVDQATDGSPIRARLRYVGPEPGAH